MMHHTVKDPDLQIRGGERGGAGSHSDPEIKWGGLKKIFCRPFDGPQFGLKLRGRPGPPGPLPWVRLCYSRSLYLTLKKLSGRTIMPLPLGLPHLGNCVANMFANPYPIVETVYLLKGPHVPIKSRLRAVSLLVSFARKSVKECDMAMRAAGELCGHQCGRPNTHVSYFKQTRDCSQSKWKELCSTIKNKPRAE